MRIAFVSDSIYPYNFGGKEKRLFDLSTELAGLGHDVHIYTMKWWPEPQKVLVHGSVTLHALCASRSMYASNKRSISQALKFAFACLKLAREPWDVVDVDHMPYFPIFAVWLVAKLRGKTLHATWHESLDLQSWRRYMGAAGVIAHLVERLSIKLPNHIGTSSAHTRLRLQSEHGRNSGVAFIGTGVDLQEVQAATAVDQQVDVLYVGRLVKDKHVDDLIGAMKIVKEFRPNAKCLIFGEGVEHARLSAQIQNLRLSDSVVLMPKLATAREVYGYMKKAKVLVLPSTREGFGIVAAEAIACGTPVITVDSAENAAAALISEGVTGSVVPLDQAEIAQAIYLWLSKKNKFEAAQFNEPFNWSNIALRQLELYKS